MKPTMESRSGRVGVDRDTGESAKNWPRTNPTMTVASAVGSSSPAAMAVATCCESSENICCCSVLMVAATDADVNGLFAVSPRKQPGGSLLSSIRSMATAKAPSSARVRSPPRPGRSRRGRRRETLCSRRRRSQPHRWFDPRTSPRPKTRLAEHGPGRSSTVDAHGVCSNRSHRLGGGDD